ILCIRPVLTWAVEGILLNRCFRSANYSRCGSELAGEATIDPVGPKAGRVKMEVGVGGAAAVDLAGGAGDFGPIEPGVAEVEFPVASGLPLQAQAQLADGAKLRLSAADEGG